MLYDFQSEHWILVNRKGHNLPTIKQKAFLKQLGWFSKGLTRRGAFVCIASLLEMRND